MEYLVVLSKENPELARDEIKSVYQAELTSFSWNKSLVSEKDNFLILDVQRRPPQERLAYTKEVALKICEFKNPEDLKKIPLKFDGSISIKHYNIENKAVRGDIRKIIVEQKNKVNLNSPENELKIYKKGEKYILTKVVWKRDNQSFERRKNEKRPFKSPVSMNPKLARTMVNLSQIKEGQTILDPFCGTGGILIEAALMEIKVSGSDIDQNMVDGSKKNLKHFSKDGLIVQSDIKDIEKTFEEKFDAVVTALPYGRSARKVGDVEKAFLTNIPKICSGIVVFMSDHDKMANLSPQYQIYSHKNLTNYIYVISANYLKELVV